MATSLLAAGRRCRLKRVGLALWCPGEETQVPPLRFNSVGMTKDRSVFHFRVGWSSAEEFQSAR
jgi:hypothetical protein